MMEPDIRMKFGNLYCSTIIRGSNDKDLTGFYYHLDWDAKKIIKKVEVPAARKQLGARGGSRGGRGLLVKDGYLYATACDKVIVYDESWNIVELFEHPHIIGHHDLAVDEDGIWCTSTMIDALFKYNWQGKVVDEWYACEDKEFIRFFSNDELPARLVSRPRHIDFVSGVEQESADIYDEQFHFNTVDVIDGRLFTFSNRKYILVQVKPKLELVQRNKAWIWAHNVILRDGRIIVNNSNLRRFEIYRPDSIKPELSLLLDNTGVNSTQFSTSGWIRGMAFFNDRYIFVGSSPSVVFLLDIIDGRVVDKMVLSDRVNDTVHSLALGTRAELGLGT